MSLLHCERLRQNSCKKPRLLEQLITINLRYLGTKSIFLMKVATQEFTVFPRGDNTLSLNANATRSTLNLARHMIIIWISIQYFHWILANLRRPTATDAIKYTAIYTILKIATKFTFSNQTHFIPSQFL